MIHYHRTARRGVTRRVLTALGLGLALAAPAASFAASPITVSKPWFRYLLPQVPAGGYMMLKNDSSTQAVLTSAASPACGMVMLHKTEHSGGIEKMVPVKSVTIPPHGTFSFAPGGYHLMCMKPQMKPGERVQVTLRFADRGPVTAAFTVYPANKSPTGR